MSNNPTVLHCHQQVDGNRGASVSLTSFLKVMLGASLVVAMISGCSKSPESENGRADSAGYIETTEQAASDMTVPMVPDPALIEGQGSADRLVVENLSGDSEQTLGSQVSEIAIAGKSLVINASAHFKVEDVVKTSNAIETLTRQQGGYVALSSISNNELDRQTFTQGEQDITLTTYARQAIMTVRLPRAKVSGFLRQVQKQVAFLHAQEFLAQDVTLDLYREQLEVSLNSDMAGELSAQRLDSGNEKEQDSNIDSIKATYAARQKQQLAELQKLDIADKVKFSTIELTFAQPASTYKEITQNLDTVIKASQPSFAAQANDAFKDGWEILKAVALGIIQLWWFWLLIALVYLLYKLLKKPLHRLLSHNKPSESESSSKAASEIVPPTADSIINEQDDREDNL